MTAIEIRQAFLDFFRHKAHTIVPSAPIVIKNDPTLMFTNAGMNQFKDFFLGNKEIIYRRVADTQKCLRVSGKHNDLEEVGLDTYHHTMFEMLGNWSFGDYFKEEAITWAWELLTTVYRIPVDMLYVTVFGGDETDGLSRDEEAFGIWKNHIAEQRILFGSKKDNFWEMGDTGPCGPCSEIHVDCRSATEKEAVRGETLVNTGHPQVIEVWNLVFMEFNRLKDSTLHQLPARHVDTGMGLERLVRILQGKTSNYDTDLFIAVIQEAEKKVQKKYGGTDSNTDVAFRVIADHIRAICFTIADGQLPSNTGAGYVIRRILRRAVRYYFSFLDTKEPLLYTLVETLAIQFESVFPALKQQQDFVTKVVREEESSFLRTLDSGMRRIEEYFNVHRANHEIDGKTAFELYDTYGFPLDLTRLIAGEKGYAVDETGFEGEMRQQKSRSRAATELDLSDWIVLKETSSVFTGYEELSTETQVTRYRKVKSKGREIYQLVLERTPFYGESGGQVGDTGVLVFGEETIQVNDTRKENDLIIHVTDKLPQNISQKIWATVDTLQRRNTNYNHTTTHLLHAALRQVLGTHVQQKGSLVNKAYLRFDFSHFAKMSEEEIVNVEKMVNEKIRQNIPVIIRQMPREEALALGAMALFGEKYGDRVRVVITDASYSIELCGGTHVQATGEIGFFKILSESANAAGVRRIEAVTGAVAENYVRENLRQLDHIKAQLKHPREVVKSIEALLQEKIDLEKKLQQWADQQLTQLVDQLRQSTEQVNGITFIGKIVEVENAEALKQLCFRLRPHFNRYVFILAAQIGDKAAVALMLDDSVAAEENLDATTVIRENIAPLIKGGGGGQKTFATAGGKDTAGLEAVIASVKALL